MAAVGLLAAFMPAGAQAASDSVQAGPTAATCRSIALPVPVGTTESMVYGGDSTGRYLVGVGFHQDGSEGLLWVDGRLRPVDQRQLAPYFQVQFNAVNSRGVIVGDRMATNSSDTDAFVYRDGRFTRLRALIPGGATNAVAVDSRGDVVGSALGSTGWEPVEWLANRPGTVRVLPTPDGVGGFASGIGEDGTVVGYLAPWPPGGPYVWPAHGRAHALPVPAGSSGGQALAIRQNTVVGSVFDPATGSTVPAVWNLRTKSFRMLSELQGAALSVNRQGTLGLPFAIVHADGRMVPVDGLVNVVTDRGTAAGTTNAFTGHAVLWLGC